MRTLGSSSTTSTAWVPRWLDTSACSAGASAGTSSAEGRYTRNSAPWPGAVVTSTHPSCYRPIPYTMLSPRPVPWPAAFVVKNGWKIWATVASSIP